MKKNTSRMTKSIIGLSFVLLFSIVSLNIYQNLVNTPKKIFIEAINSLTSDYRYFNGFENDNYKFLNNDFTYEGKIDMKFDSILINYLNLKPEYDNVLKGINVLNDLKINYNLQKQDNALLLTMNNKYKDKNLNLSYYKNNNNHYLKLDDYSEEYIDLSSFINDLNKNLIDIKNQDYLLKFISKSFIDNLDDKYFKTVKEDVIIDDKNTRVNKNILTLDKHNIITILDALITDLKNDEKAYNMLIKLYPSFKDFKIDILNNINDDFIIYFNTYTYNNKLIKYEIEFANLDKIINKDIDNFIISFFKNEQCIELLVNKQSFLQIRFSNIDNGYNIDCYINESKILSFNVNNKGSKKQISLTSGNITNNNINVLFSEIFDKNILEDYDKIEDKLSF